MYELQVWYSENGNKNYSVEFHDSITLCCEKFRKMINEGCIILKLEVRKNGHNENNGKLEIGRNPLETCESDSIDTSIDIF